MLLSAYRLWSSLYGNPRQVSADWLQTRVNRRGVKLIVRRVLYTNLDFYGFVFEADAAETLDEPLGLTEDAVLGVQISDGPRFHDTYGLSGFLIRELKSSEPRLCAICFQEDRGERTDALLELARRLRTTGPR